jgi:hypothetical protein
MKTERFEQIKVALEKKRMDVKNFPDAFDNLDLMKIAVNNHPFQMQYASGELKDNADLTLISKTLHYASNRLRSDFKVVCKMINVQPGNFRFASETLRDNVNIAKLALDKGFSPFSISGNNVLNSYDLVKQYLETFDKIDDFCYFSNELKDDSELAKLALSKNGLMLKHVGLSFRADKAYVEIAVKNNVMALEYASYFIRDDFEFIKPLILKDASIYIHLSDRLKEDPDVIRMGLLQNYDIIVSHYPDSVKHKESTLYSFLMADFIAFQKEYPDTSQIFISNLKNEWFQVEQMVKKTTQEDLIKSLLRVENKYRQGLPSLGEQCHAIKCQHHIRGSGLKLILSELTLKSFHYVERKIPYLMKTVLFKDIFDKYRSERKIKEYPMGDPFLQKKKTRKLGI